MLKPIIVGGEFKLASGETCVLDETVMSSSESVEAARLLHEILIEDCAIPQRERMNLARQIAGRLFAAESFRILPDIYRHFFVLLRTDAHARATTTDDRRLPNRRSVDGGYDRLADGACSDRAHWTR